MHPALLVIELLYYAFNCRLLSFAFYFFPNKCVVKQGKCPVGFVTWNPRVLACQT